jgi:hypothetical protein
MNLTVVAQVINLILLFGFLFFVGFIVYFMVSVLGYIKTKEQRDKELLEKVNQLIQSNNKPL